VSGLREEDERLRVQMGVKPMVSLQQHREFIKWANGKLPSKALASGPKRVAYAKAYFLYLEGLSKSPPKYERYLDGIPSPAVAAKVVEQEVRSYCKQHGVPIERQV
jgi:GTP cyclohydrolase I